LQTDTIIAPATPPGSGGLAVIRLSGPRAEATLLDLFRPASPRARLLSHRLYLGQLFGSDGLAVDEVMVVIMRAPHSFTREDVVEIHCHGGPAVIHAILDLFLQCGIRMARPGEFTQRAFLNGRLDLSQAEAVADLIHAHSSGAARVALGQLQGRLARIVGEARHQLIEVLSLVEVHIDFSDQDLDLPDFQPLALQVADLVLRLKTLLDSYRAGRMLHEGVRILILGKPNVGKSSLLNALLGEARAIVTEIPGTTRDTIEETLLLRDVPVRLIDTAGIRHTEDPVELEGVRRAKEKIGSADLVLLVVDGSAAPDQDDRLALFACDQNRLVLVVNKSDLDQQDLGNEFQSLERVFVSAKQGLGLDILQSAIKKRLFAGGAVSGEDVLLYEQRHKDSIATATRSLERFVAGVHEQLEAEFLALELREAIVSLGEVSGDSVTDEVLAQIFSKFCIGK
jgi:tRNA modification GTPase